VVLVGLLDFDQHAEHARRHLQKSVRTVGCRIRDYQLQLAILVD